MDKEPRHHCPGCGAAQDRFDRYPWYFCRECLRRAEDAEGRRLVFGNVSFSGGLMWAYADEPTRYDDKALGVVCLIDTRPVLVHEARFGGVVAEPLTRSEPRVKDDREVVLTHGNTIAQARSRLKGHGQGR